MSFEYNNYIYESNKELRSVFIEFYEDTFHPNKKLIAHSLGINYNTFKLWANGNHNFQSSSLIKIEKFLKERNYKIKQLT